MDKDLADPKVPDYIKRSALRHPGLALPVVRCKDGRKRYILTAENFYWIIANEIAPRDTMPQPRDPVTKEYTVWTEAMLANPGRYILTEKARKHWLNEGPGSRWWNGKELELVK